MRDVTNKTNIRLKYINFKDTNICGANVCMNTLVHSSKSRVNLSPCCSNHARDFNEVLFIFESIIQLCFILFLTRKSRLLRPWIVMEN